MIDIYMSNDTTIINKKVNKHKTILIIGEAQTSFGLNQILYYDSVKKVENDYLSGSIVEAFKIAKDYGAEYVFLLSIKDKTDFIDMIEVIRQLNFAYICPVSVYLSDYFYDINKDNRKMYYAQDYLNRASAHNESIAIFTDRHAELYGDIDEYLYDMKINAIELLNKVNTGAKGNHLLFVTNNIKDCQFANVALATSLSNSEVGEYPVINKKEVVFDIDDIDIGQNPIIYFKNNLLTGTTIENLVSFEKQVPLLKSVYVDRILKYVSRTIDLTGYHGKLYTPHQKVMIERDLSNYLDGLIGVMIRDYSIVSIVFIKEEIGVGRVECSIDLWPKSTIEKYRLVIK